MFKVLIVDDLIENIELLEAYLSSEDYLIYKAYNGQEALEIFDKEGPDIVITDVMMPIMDGYTLCRILKGREDVYIPVIVITALQDHNEKIEGLKAGADEFLTKPFNHIELKTRIKSLLKQKKLNDQLNETLAKLEGQNKKLKWELEMARYVQQLILPKDLSFTNDCTISYKYLPAHYLGGDFFDVIPIDNNRIGIFISDVAGHGAGAAMLTVMIKTLIRGFKDELIRPSLVLKSLNEEISSLLAEENGGTYVTAIYGVYDCEKGTILLAGAGHPYPILIDRINNEAKFIKLIGFPLGFVDSTSYEEVEHPLQGNQGLFLYTDGLYELQGNNNKMLGFENIEGKVIENIVFKGEEFLDNLLEGIKKEYPIQRDDINMIILEKSI